MTEIKSYLLRLICCGFFISLASALLRGKRAGKLVALCGGCLMILTAVRPLLQVEFSALPDLVSGLSRTERQALAREKNDAILRNLVEEQTAAWIEAQASLIGMQAQFVVYASETAQGLWVPERVRVQGSWTQEQREILSERIERDLALPPERQEWEGG